MLNERKKRFCREYVKDLKIGAAMVRAGYKQSTADKCGHMLFKDPDVAFYLKQLMDKMTAKEELSAEMVIEQFRRLAFADILNYYIWSETKKRYLLKRLDELTVAQRAPISGYDPVVGYTFYGKDQSLDKLARFFKLYSDIDQTITNYVLMPELKLNGKPMVFNVGEPVTRRDKKS